MAKNPWTAKELKEFDKLIRNVSSFNQLTRIAARLGMSKFVAEHGKEKCDAMFAYLESKGKK
jgi:hypothetical protein